MFLEAVIVIALISIIWAFWSLKNLSIKKELKETRDRLKKGRVIYQSHRD